MGVGHGAAPAGHRSVSRQSSSPPPPQRQLLHAQDQSRSVVQGSCEVRAPLQQPAPSTRRRCAPPLQRRRSPLRGPHCRAQRPQVAQSRSSAPSRLHRAQSQAPLTLPRRALEAHIAHCAASRSALAGRGCTPSHARGPPGEFSGALTQRDGSPASRRAEGRRHRSASRQVRVSDRVDRATFGLVRSLQQHAARAARQR